MGAARSIDILVVGVNKSAFGAAKDVILAGGGTKAALAMLGVEGERGHSTQEEDHVGNEE